MGYTIAIAGKGGTGKTTIASLLIEELLAQKKGSVLAVDADPNSTLASTLGIEAQENIGAIVDSIAKDQSLIPKSMSKNEYIEYRINTALSESNGFDLLVMGRPEGPGCYCYVNNVLRDNLKKLINNYDYIVIDNEAGMEHFSRRTTRIADCLVMVSNHSVLGIRTAINIHNLIKELDIKVNRELLIVNRLPKKDESIENLIRNSGIAFAGCIPESKELLESSLKGDSIKSLKSDSDIKKVIKQIGEKIWG